MDRWRTWVQDFQRTDRANHHGENEAALLRLWREKRGEAQPTDLSSKLQGSAPYNYSAILAQELFFKVDQSLSEIWRRR
jgi:hypothetical protein